MLCDGSFPTWSSSLSPCFRCTATLAQIRRCENHASLWTRRTTADYARVLQDEAVHREVRFKLKNSTVGKSKCLASDIPELGLRERDRLKPSATILDTARFDDQSAFSVVVLFWRAPLQPTVQRRHPILNVALGTGVETFSLDILHTLHLGVFQYWILPNVWQCAQRDVWATGMTRLVDRKRHSLKAMRSDLRYWYPAYEATKASMGETVTRVNHLKESMIGREPSQPSSSKRLKPSTSCRLSWSWFGNMLTASVQTWAWTL